VTVNIKRFHRHLWHLSLIYDTSITQLKTTVNFTHASVAYYTTTPCTSDKCRPNKPSINTCCWW